MGKRGRNAYNGTQRSMRVADALAEWLDACTILVGRDAAGSR
jgi:hypothetical protein